jgi:hypothetical protein
VEIYFYDANMRYIGHRKLNEGETIPANATTEIANAGDRQEAYLVNNKWAVNAIVEAE